MLVEERITLAKLAVELDSFMEVINAPKHAKLVRKAKFPQKELKTQIAKIKFDVGNPNSDYSHEEVQEVIKTMKELMKKGYQMVGQHEESVEKGEEKTGKSEEKPAPSNKQH